MRPLRRPSVSVVILAVAVLLALSGTAEAATGGTFLLGRSNAATTVTTLTNTRGTALSLFSTSKTPALRVGNQVQVPDLNASLLGGIPASGFLQGGGTAKSGRLTMTAGEAGHIILSGPASYVAGDCSSGVATTTVWGNQFIAGQTAGWWGTSGAGYTDSLQLVGEVVATGSGFGMATVQVTGASTVTTYTVNQYVDSSQNCHFAAQMLVTNG